MKQIIDGYEITTASTEAAEQTKRGIESFIEWRMDPFDWLDVHWKPIRIVSLPPWSKVCCW